jgi:glycosyltransferase involved in cell wall biosynthesis
MLTMTVARPLVSIITPTRNRPNVLARALESIAEQTMGDYEVLIVDDGSPKEVLEAYEPMTARSGGRARVLTKDALRDKSGTPAIARNRGIREARGTWVAFLDDDDRWVDPHHLEIALASLERARGDLFFANMYCERNGVVEIPDAYPDSPQLTKGPLVLEHPRVFHVDLNALVSTLRHHSIHPDVIVVNRQLLASVGGFCERVVFSEDYELAMRLVDAATSVLYRPDRIAAYALPMAGSHSLRVSPMDQLLDRLCATSNIRIACKNSAVRRCARQRQSWVLRELADELGASNRWSEALRLRWEAVAVYPSPGSIFSLSRRLIGHRQAATI